MNRSVALLALTLLGWASMGVAQEQAEPRWPRFSVIPVLFCPTDWAIDSDPVQAEARALAEAMSEIQRHYLQALGRTFVLNELEVVQGRHDRQQYHIIWNGGDIYEDGIEFDGNMEHEVVHELHDRGFPTPPGQDEDGYVVMIFVKGAGGYAGGRELHSANGGWAIVGDWAINSIAGDVPDQRYWWSGRDKQVGAVAHELGHTFDLPHPDAVGMDNGSSLMGAWWDYPRLGFNPWERQRLMEEKGAFFRVIGCKGTRDEPKTQPAPEAPQEGDEPPAATGAVRTSPRPGSEACPDAPAPARPPAASRPAE